MEKGKRGLTGKKLKGRTGHLCNAWKGGKYISYGYKMIYSPSSPMKNSDGYVLEHRMVMSDYIGRPLYKNEIVHHKDGNKLNNSIDNLEITTRSSHIEKHRKEISKAMIKATRRISQICNFCNKIFIPKRKPRCKRIFCSKICSINFHK